VLLFYCTLFIVTLVFIALIRKYAKRWGLLDVPNERSMHNNVTARGAGIAFYLSVLLTLPFFYFDFSVSHFWTLTAILFIYFMGIGDDYIDLSPKIKFSVIIFSTILLSLDNLFISKIGIFFGFNIALYWFTLPFTLFVVAGFTNALNLIDGLDGLSASLSIIILAAFFYIGICHNDLFLMLLSGSFMVTLVAFLIYNWYPASIFMGDSGSLTLGFVISVLGIKSLMYIPAVSILYIGAIPILDTLIVMIRRKQSGHSFFAADSCHMHHIVKSYFQDSTPKTVMFFIFLQAVYTLIGLQFTKNIDQGILLLVFIINILLLYRFLNWMILRQGRVC